MVSERPRTRREARELRNRAQSARIRKEAQVFNAPRLVLLGVVSAITVVAPLSGIVSPNLSIASPNFEFSTNQTLLSVVAKASDATDYDSDLNAVPASSRSRVVEATALGQCAAQGSANGDASAAPEKNLLLWPLSSGSYTFTSPWGMRVNPVTGTRLLHEGVDLSAPTGTNIYAIADGIVTESGMQGSTGMITIKHVQDGEVFYSRYLHMYGNGIYVHEGDEVKAGDVIAGVGSTGRSTGPHLHFEIRNSDKESVDPMGWMKRHGARFVNQICS